MFKSLGKIFMSKSKVQTNSNIHKSIIPVLLLRKTLDIFGLKPCI